MLLSCKLKNTHISKLSMTRVAERIQYRLKDKDPLPASRKPENFSKGTTVTDNRNNQSGFKTAREYHNLLKDRKRESSTEAGTEELVRKKIRSRNDSANEAKLNEKVPTQKEGTLVAHKLQQVVTGDVSQIVKIAKQFPDLNLFYEIYANVYKVDNSKARQKVLLLRNNSGPVVQGIFNEIDVQMMEVKPGDAVRCVGKFIKNRLHFFKVSVVHDNRMKLVNRLYTLANFELNRNAANHSKAPK